MKIKSIFCEIKNFVFKSFKSIHNLVDELSSYIIFFFFLLTIFICTQVADLCYIYLQLSNGKDVNITLFQYINIFWRLIQTDDVITVSMLKDKSAYILSSVTFLMNAAIALGSILLTILTFISYLKRSSQLKKSSCFKKVEIHNEGVDDIKIMSKNFKDANYIAVYSQTFSWIERNETIRKLLEDKAKKGKLTLVTCDDVEVVKSNLISCTDQLKTALVQKPGLSTKSPIRFSYIERDNTHVLLYRQEEEDSKKFVYVVKETNQSRFLLQTIGNLVKI